MSRIPRLDRLDWGDLAQEPPGDEAGWRQAAGRDADARAALEAATARLPAAPRLAHLLARVLAASASVTDN